MNTTRLMQLLGSFVALCVLVVGMNGCNDDATTNPPPAGFSASSTSLSAAPAAATSATLSGGTAPYTLQTGPDTSIATASITGSTLDVTTVASGFTSVVVQDAASATIRVNISVTGPITYTIFPLANGNAYVYGGYAISPSSSGSVRLPDPNNVYRTSWTLSGPLPGPNPPAGAFLIRDSTTLHLGATDTTVTRSLVIIRNPLDGSFTFFQTLGPFFRALGILPLGRLDTVRAIKVADPSVGIGGTWTAFDSSYANVGGSTVRLQIIGTLEGGEVITDSAQTIHNTLRFRTHRNIFVDASQPVNNSTTAKLWLAKDIGPVQVNIAEDTENIGHFRVLRDRNF